MAFVRSQPKPYLDAFLLPVRREAEDVYRKWAKVSAEVWLANGALSYVEARADDVPFGNLTSFPRAVQLTEDEVLYIALATYRDRAHRDEVNAKVMADPRLKNMMIDSPVDGKRMIFGGFNSVVSTV